MAKREFLMLAHKYSVAKHGSKIGGWWVSEKLDGIRAFWDGGVSRGLEASKVPWANTTRDAYEYVATGLWTRGGKIIHAPDWLLDQLPVGFCLDGELWAGRAAFQSAQSIVRSHNASDEAWRKIRYHIFGLPAYRTVFQTSTINTQGFYKELNWDECKAFLRSRLHSRHGGWPAALTLEQYAEALQAIGFQPTDNVVVHPQWQLPRVTPDSHLMESLGRVCADGGEGLIVRDPHQPWVPRRSWGMLKVKKLHDAEGVVVGYMTGKITGKDSQFLGKVGALRVKYRDVVFELSSGLTHDDRNFADAEMLEWAVDHPDSPTPPSFKCPAYPIGTVVTFKYADLSRDGVPRFARIWRKKVPE